MQLDAVGSDAGLTVKFVHESDSVETNRTMDVLPRGGRTERALERGAHMIFVLNGLVLPTQDGFGVSAIIVRPAASSMTG
jgi:hypothetical protein